MKISDLDAAIAATRALGHLARMRTAAMLRTGELCLCQITEVLGLAPSTVSLHIKELKRAGLVSERKEGRWVFSPSPTTSTPDVGSKQHWLRWRVTRN